jgi:transcriptional regulator with XRE-family HTH domain
MEAKDKSQMKHIGRKSGRLRELLGIKQETVADRLGISQQAVSKLEQSEHIEDATLERLAKALGVSSETIKNFNEEIALSFINNFNDSSVNHGAGINYYPTFNPIDKWIEALDKNEKLYEALLKAEREKIALLEKLLDSKK